MLFTNERCRSSVSLLFSAVLLSIKLTLQANNNNNNNNIIIIIIFINLLLPHRPTLIYELLFFHLSPVTNIAE